MHGFLVVSHQTKFEIACGEFLKKSSFYASNNHIGNVENALRQQASSSSRFRCTTTPNTSDNDKGCFGHTKRKRILTAYNEELDLLGYWDEICTLRLPRKVCRKLTR